jgi:hypothetical protein
MKGHRFAGVLLLCLLTATGAASAIVYSAGHENAKVDAAIEAPLFRIFLTDGTSLVSYGELARLDEDRVVFSMPTSASIDNPELHLINISAERIDWRKTVDYAESARAARYLATRAETDYALLTSRVEQMLNSVALTSDAKRRLTIVEGARKVLADWPPDHYNYKLDEIEQTLTAARLADSAAERTSLLSVALASLDREAKALPAEWAAATKVTATAKLAHETQIDRTYQVFGARILKTASDRARSADVRGVQQLMSQVKLEDKTLGELRPDAVISLLAAVEERLDAARRLRLERDRWALKLPDLRRYRSSVNPILRSLGEIEPELEDIKSLAGSGPDALGSILRTSDEILKNIATIKPPDDLREAHGLLVSAAQLAASAAKIRREAALTANMTRAWDASSAAAGALMLAARVQTDMQNAFRAPQLPR